MILNYGIKKKHASDWLLFPKNIGSRLSLDETAFSNGDLYTVLTNKTAKGKKGAVDVGAIAIDFLVLPLARHIARTLAHFCKVCLIVIYKQF